MEQAKAKPRKPKWKQRMGTFLDTVYPDGKVMDVYRYRHRGCGSPSCWWVTVAWGNEYRDQFDFLVERGLRDELLKAELPQVVEVCYREKLIEGGGDEASNLRRPGVVGHERNRP